MTRCWVQPRNIVSGDADDAYIGGPTKLRRVNITIPESSRVHRRSQTLSNTTHRCAQHACTYMHRHTVSVLYCRSLGDVKGNNVRWGVLTVFVVAHATAKKGVVSYKREQVAPEPTSQASKETSRAVNKDQARALSCLQILWRGAPTREMGKRVFL